MRSLFYIFICMATIMLFGCSGQNNSPISPMGEKDIQDSFGILPVSVSEYSEDGSPMEGYGALGLFQLHIDSENVTGDLHSIRSAALEDVLEIVDITNFLSLAPCSDCVKLQSVSLDPDGNPVLNIGIKHPFGAGDPQKPVTGQNRGDLHVFNIEGTVISNIPSVEFPLINQKTADFVLANADGLSGYLDSQIDEFYPTEATLHPYITHFDDYSAGNFNSANPMGFESVTTPPPSGNLVMAMGSDYDFQDYVFKLNDDIADFIFAVGCTYAVSAASKIERFSPEYRVPQHNKKSASEVSLVIIDNQLAGERTDSTAQVEVHVVDISHGVSVGTGLDEMRAESNVDDIFINIPSVMTDMLVIDGNNSISGTGHDPANPLVYEATITNTAGAVEGTYQGLIKVSDTCAPGLNTSPLLIGQDGIERVSPISNPLEGLFDINEFATYQVFDIYVMPGNDNPVAILESDPDPAIIQQYTSISLDGTSSYDPDGTIDLYEFDFDWDEVEDNFDIDDSNDTGIITSPSYDTAGNFIIGLRVTDNEGAVAYDSIDLTVEEGCIIFVDDDNTSGPWDGSSAHPYQYVQDGVDNASDDCIVWIKPGTYNEDPGGDPWTSDDAEVTIVGMTDLTIHGEGRPVINCHRYYGPPWPSGIRADACTNLTIEGVDISLNYHNQGYIRLEGCDTVTIDNVKGYPSSDQPSGGAHAFLWATGTPNITMKNCEYVNTTNSSTSSHHLALLNGCNNSVITLNEATNNANATNLYQTFAAWLTVYNSSNVEISKNILGHHHKTASAINYQDLKCIRISGGSGVVIRNNLIYDLYFHNSNTSAESRNWAIQATGSPNIEIYHNTIDSFGPNNASGPGYTYGISLDSGCTNAVLHSNILTNIHANGGSTSYGLYSGASVSMDYSNVWGLTGGTTFRYSGSASEGTGGIELNPQFTDPSNGDYTLQTGSPCEDAGKDGYDMGCYGGPDPMP